jgi:hypothetical protein
MFENETQEGTENTENTETNETDEILGMLEAELIQARAQSGKSKRLALLMMVLFGAYLAWAGSQVNKMLDPEGIAQAATGLALEAVPAAGANLRLMVVDGAPDLARSGTQAVLDLVPVYRAVLEDELSPVIDEVTAILAQSVVHSLVKSGDKPKGALATQAALDAGADAVMLRLDTVLERAMDEPADMGGPSPRQTIQISLGKLERIDAGLKRIASGQGDPKERELILSWISMLQQYDSEAETAAIQAYKQGARVDD